MERHRRSGRLALLIVLAFVGLVGARVVATTTDVAQSATLDAALATFDADVARRVAEDAGGFASVAVFNGDTVIWSKAYGWADIEHKIAANDRTIGRIGSISKSFTAVALMQLVERGTISLDEPVEKYLPEIRNLAKSPAGAKAITFRMLASHTSGLQREPDLADAATGPIAEWEAKVLGSIPATSFQTPPATEYAYSNIGFGILGLAVSRAARTPFMELVTRQVLTPLGLASSTYVVSPPDLASRLAVGYVRDRATGKLSSDLPTREHLGRGYKVPNGGIYSTTGDLARFAAALMGEGRAQVLTRKSREEMMRPQAPATVYGLGLMIRTTNGETFVGHGGSVAGYNADLLFNPRTRLGVAMLRTTTYNPPTAALLQQLVALHTGH
jgi:CubicO group peptidase (beta-lactamase class C family)